MKPVLNDFKQAIGDKAVVLKIDVARNPAAAQAHSMQGVPALAISKNGRIVWRAAGVMSAAQLQRALEPFL